MKHPLRTRSALLSLALTSACGGSNTANNTANNTTTATTATSGSEQTPVVVAQDDVSEVAAPNELVALVRATSVRAVATRIARYGFVSDAQASAMAGEVLSQFLGNEALGRVVRTDRPMDGAVVFSGGRYSFVVSFAVPVPAEAVRRVGNGYRARSVGNGVIELTVMHDEQQSGPRDPDDDIDRDENVCFVSPTPSPSEGRLTCTTGNRSALEVITPFLARTLTRRESRQDAFVATVFPNAVRTMVSADVARAFDEIERDIDNDLGNNTRPPYNHQDVRQPLVRLAHDVVANFRALWSETQGVDLAITFDDQRVRLQGSVDVRSASGSFTRALIEGSRSAPPMPDQFLQRIPSDSAVILTGSLGHQAWAPYARPLSEVAVALARSEARLSAPIVTQLQSILAHTFDTDASVVAGASSDARGRIGSVAVARLSDAAHATQSVADARQMVGILRNPTFSRAVDTFMRQMDAPRMNIDWRQVRELPAAGLPAGSFAFQLPNFQALAQQSRSSVSALNNPRAAITRPAAATRATPPTPQQYLIVPEGNHLTVVHGDDVRALWTQISQRTGAPLDLALHGARAGALTFSVVPAGIPNAMLASGTPEGAREAGNARTVIGRMPDHGATPAFIRVSNAEVDGNQRFSLEIEVQASTLTGLARAMR